MTNFQSEMVILYMNHPNYNEPRLKPTGLTGPEFQKFKWIGQGFWKIEGFEHKSKLKKSTH